MKLLLTFFQILFVFSFAISQTTEETKTAPAEKQSMYDFTMKDIDGMEVSLADFKGTKNTKTRDSWCLDSRQIILENRSRVVMKRLKNFVVQNLV